MLHICMDDSPRFTWLEMDEVDSTNNYLRGYTPQQTEGLTLITAEHQTAGRGQIGNTWESERGANLLFSLLYYPRNVEAHTGFILSQAVALGVAEGVEAASGISPVVKWPNDIYVGEEKLCGILIETEIAGRRLQRMIAGVGINVNQKEFISGAPNPVSLAQILGKGLERRIVLEQVIGCIQRRLVQAESEPETLRHDYMARLYRSDGWHWFEDEGGRFEAEIAGIEPDGHLLLKKRNDVVCRYAFKEVSWLAAL